MLYTYIHMYILSVFALDQRGYSISKLLLIVTVPLNAVFCDDHRVALCLMEKLQISLADPMTTLNKRFEIVAKCRHRDKLLLDKW